MLRGRDLIIDWGMGEWTYGSMSVSEYGSILRGRDLIIDWGMGEWTYGSMSVSEYGSILRGRDLTMDQYDINIERVM